MKKFIAALSKDDIHNLEIIFNKVFCAEQALRLDAVPPYAPKTAASRFFREALFAYADALYLQECFWLDLARRCKIGKAEIQRMYVDFYKSELQIKA